MDILFSIMFITAVVSLSIPFMFWMWTNIVKTEDVFGIMRLRIFLWSWLVCWLAFAIDIGLMIIILI